MLQVTRRAMARQMLTSAANVFLSDAACACRVVMAPWRTVRREDGLEESRVAFN